MFACFSSSVFIITLVSFDEHSDLRQVNVRVEIVDKPKGNWTIFTVARRDETRGTIVKPLSYRMFRRWRSFRRSQYAEGGRYREIRETQERGVEENMRGVIVIGKGKLPVEGRRLMPRHYGGLVGM